MRTYENSTYRTFVNSLTFVLQQPFVALDGLRLSARDVAWVRLCGALQLPPRTALRVSRSGVVRSDNALR